MNDFIEALSKYLQNRRDLKRNVYNIMSALHRATIKGRITWEQGIKLLENMRVKWGGD